MFHEWTHAALNYGEDVLHKTNPPLSWMGIISSPHYQQGAAREVVVYEITYSVFSGMVLR